MINKKRIIGSVLAAALAVTPLYVQAAGVIGGTVTSYGSENGKVTLTLLAANGTAVQTATVTGNSSIYVMENVPDGQYTLKASKYNHATRDYDVTISGGELSQDVKLCIQGDVSGDGRINVGDTAKAYSHVRRTSPLADTYAQCCADMSGDGKLNVGDVARIYGLVRNANGSAELPSLPDAPVEENKNQPIEINGAMSFDADVVSGHLVYYKLSQVSGMKLTVKDPMAYVLCNGVIYEAKDGEVVLPELTAGSTIVAIGNRGAEDLIIPVTVDYDPGHRLNPIEIGGVLEFDAAVDTGDLVYFDLYRLSETNLTIEDPNAYVIYNGVTYEAKDGKVTVPALYSANTNTPISVAIGNRGTEDRVFAVTLNYDPGHRMNPIPLSNGNLSTYCAEGNSQGVYYCFTAPKVGTLTVRLTQTVDCNITITSDIVEGGTRSVSLSDKPDSTSLSFKMSEGETVSVCIVMNPQNGFNYPEATVNTTVRFR
jgi:hypothetical protein